MSLRLRLTLGLVLVNAAVLSITTYWATRQAEDLGGRQDRRARDLMVEVARLVQSRIQPEDVGNLARMLSWPLWSEFEDALIMDARVLERHGGGSLPIGVFLNPKGSARRRADFQLQEITDAIVSAVQSGASLPVAGGVALPLFAPRAALDDGRAAWGGVFVRLVPPAEPPSLAWRALLLGLAATALGSFFLYLMLDRAVLRPVLRLGEEAERFGRGAGGAPPPDPDAAPEVRALTASFAEMMQAIRGFQGELERRIEAATGRAAEAERLAARQDRLAALGILAAGLAHEINSPLAGAMHSLEILRREAPGDRAERYGVLVEEALQRIRELVQRLLQMAPQHAIGGSCRIAAVVDDLRDFLASRLGRHRLTLACADPGLRVRGARGDWFPLLLNLVQNALDALDAAPEGAGEVRVSAAAAADGGAEVRVRDDGPGAPAELLPHLFEPFVTGKEPGRGTGLGLALAHATVRQLRGTIEAGNLPGGGFEVRVRVPAPEPEPR